MWNSTGGAAHELSSAMARALATMKRKPALILTGWAATEARTYAQVASEITLPKISMEIERQFGDPGRPAAGSTIRSTKRPNDQTAPAVAANTVRRLT